jgi:hypothetical protein
VQRGLNTFVRAHQAVAEAGGAVVHAVWLAVLGQGVELLPLAGVLRVVAFDVLRGAWTRVSLDSF